MATCAAFGIEVIPVPPAAADEWTVEFQHPVELTNIELMVEQGESVMPYSPVGMCSKKPPICWEFAPWSGPWVAGQVRLEVHADGFGGAECTIELE